MAALLTIPLELLVSVSSYLPTSDLTSLRYVPLEYLLYAEHKLILCTFRLTCKQVEKSLYEWFSEEFFAKKQFMLTYPSLKTLVDISQHIGFSKKLKHIIVATNVYDDVPLCFRDKDATTRYTQGRQDQKALLSTGMDREMLTEAFQNLENLQTVGIRDYNASNRIRDGKHASWSSWGATTVHRETGVDLSFSYRKSYGTELGTCFVDHVFSSIVYALGKANSSTKAIEVLLHHLGLPDTAFFLPDFLLPTVEPLLGNLTTLLLNVSLASEHLHTNPHGLAWELKAGRNLRGFLAHTPGLTHLRLNFQKTLVANNTAFAEWLSLPTPAHGSPTDIIAPTPIALPLLKTLEFGQVKLPPSTLLAIVTKFAPTLKELSLWRMALYSETAPPFGHKPSYWQEFFERLSNVQPLELNRLKVGMLQQESRYLNSMLVNFRAGEAEEDDGKDPLKEMSYSGKAIKGFYKELIDRVCVDWPDLVSQKVLDSDSSMDDDYANPDELDQDDEDDDDEEEE